jgi:CRISPR-associated protein Cmr3
MNRTGLCLEPLDVLFFRDGRPFDAATKVISGLPTPQVLAGAVRTALLEKYGCDFAALRKSTKDGKSFAEGLPAQIRWIAGARFRGPWLCRLPGAGSPVADVFVAVPVTVHTGKKGTGNVRLLGPLRAEHLPGWKGRLRPLWLAGTEPTAPASGFIDREGLEQLLAGETPDAKHLHSLSAFYEFDNRTGIGIDAEKLTTGDGEIYGIRFMSVKPGFGFYADILLPEDAPSDALAGISFLAFGGEGKRVAVHPVSAFEGPKYVPVAGKKSFLLLTTPAVTNPDGSPYLPRNCVVAAVNSPLATSGWDIARGGPKPTQFRAPAGSVYFLDSPDPVPEQPDEFGYGCHLQGVWTDE